MEHEPDDQPQQADRWFREPTVREHRIGAGLFISFGVFFVLLFFLQQGWWFRWVILVLGVFSIMRGLRHLMGALSNKR